MTGDVIDFPGGGPRTDEEKYDVAIHRQNGTSEKTHWPDGTPKTPDEQRMQACHDRINSPENRRLRPARKARLDAMFARIAKTDPAELTPREQRIKELFAASTKGGSHNPHP